MKSMLFLLGLVGLPILVNGANVVYTGSSDSGDITLPSNWPGNNLPSSTDTVVFTNSMIAPLSGLMLGTDFMIQNIKFMRTETPLEIDLDGNKIVMPETRYRGLADANSTPVPEMLFYGTDAKHQPVVIKNGTITNLVSINMGTFADVTITNANVYMQRPKMTFGWYSKLTVAKDAVLEAMDLPYGDVVFPFNGGNGNTRNPARFTVDGGLVRLRSNGTNWRRSVLGIGSGNKVFELKNGGRYDDCGVNAALYVGSAYPTILTIHDGGELTMTNSVDAAETTNRGINISNTNIVFSVSNATIRVSRYSVNSRYHTNLFENAVADFVYHGSGVAPANTNMCGYIFMNSSTNSYVRIGGAQTDFNASMLDFRSQSTSNLVEMTDGNVKISTIKFTSGAVRNVFRQTGGNLVVTNLQVASSVSNRVELLGGSFTSNRMYFDGSRNGEIDIRDSKITMNGPIEFWGTGNQIRLTGTSGMLGGTYFQNDSFNTMIQDGGAITGGLVRLGTPGNTLVLTNNAYRYMQYQINGIQFTNGKTNNVIVIDDSTILQDGSFAGSYKSTGSVTTDYGCVYTNCENSAIVFRGANPRLIFGSAKTSAGGGWWTTATLGSFDLNATLGTEPLDHPLEFRFVLPEGGYTQAPLQSTNQTASRPLVPAGNMVIKVDIGDFQPTAGKRSMPLVRDPSNFKCGNHSFIDIDSLNRNNAANLPDGSYLKYVQETDASGKVIAGRIDLVFRWGLVLIVR